MQNKKIVLIILVLVIGLLIVSLISSQRFDDIFKDEVDFNTLEVGTYSNIREKQSRIIETDAQWGSFWNRTFSFREPLLSINFDDNMVIAVFMGEVPTGGHVIRIDKVLEGRREIDVRVKEIYPGENCLVTTSFTQPYHIISLDKSDDNKPVSFEFERITQNCK